MARVFLATERALGRQVVIKTLPDDAWTSSAAQRFHREILTAAQLQHANIVPVLAAGDAEGVPYFTMPWIDGASLRERIARGPVPLGEAVGILRDVARALAAAHAKGVVHRDIKPENILLSAGAALVTDFGVAKAVSLATQGAGSSAHMTALGVSVGTPAYMAPEQIAADPGLDHRADLYAWGVVAYELLAGARPFADLTGTALIQAQMSTPPAPLGARSPALPAPLADLVMRCLAKEPAARPQSAGELLAVLDLPSGERAATGRPVLRRPLLAVGALLIALVALWATLGRRGPRADEGTIAIAPFRVGGAAPEVRYLREGLGDLMVPQLQTIPARRAAAMRVMLDRWRRTAGAADEDLDDARASRVAAEAGAGEFVMGEIVGTRDRLTVTARLLRSRDGHELAKASVEGSADEISTVATKLLTELLSLRDGATQERMRAVLSAMPDAIAPYLRAEQSYRRGRYNDASNAFAEAWRIDTTFAIAALRVSIANGWRLGDPIPGPWNRRAWTHRDRLSGVDSMLLIATVGESFPAPMEVQARFRSIESLANRGNTAELWYAFGDFLAHNGELAEQPDAWKRAVAAFARAEALDSSFTPALEHQAMGQLILGDTAAALRAHARQTARDSTGDFFRINDFMMRTLLGPPSAVTEALDDLERRGPQDIAFAVGMVITDAAGGGTVRIDVADSALARAQRHRDAPGVIAFESVWTRELAWNTGRPALALRRPAPADDAYGLSEEVIAALVSDGDSAQARRSGRALQAFAATQRAGDPDVPNALARFTLAISALADGDTATAERMHRDLRGMTPPADQPWLGNGARLLEQLLGAQLAVARRAPDAAARVGAVDSLLIHLPSLDRRFGRYLGNHIVSGLWETIGQPERALRALERRDGQTANAMFLADRWRRRARLANQLGRRADEITALRSFIALRERAEPQLQPEVAKARARLAELSAR